MLKIDFFFYRILPNSQEIDENFRYYIKDFIYRNLGNSDNKTTRVQKILGKDSEGNDLCVKVEDWSDGNCISLLFGSERESLDLAGLVCAKKHLDSVIPYAEDLRKSLDAEYSNNVKLQKERFELSQFVESCERAVGEHEKIIGEKLEEINLLNLKIATLQNQLKDSVLNGVDESLLDVALAGLPY